MGDPEAQFREWCKAEGLDPEDTQSSIAYEADFEQGFNRPLTYDSERRQ